MKCLNQEQQNFIYYALDQVSRSSCWECGEAQDAYAEALKVIITNFDSLNEDVISAILELMRIPFLTMKY